MLRSFTFCALAAVLASLPACSTSGKERTTSLHAALADDVLEITSSLALDYTSIGAGTVTATVTYMNAGATPVTINAAVIAGRPPGGTHAGGPYLDFGPTIGSTTLAPCQTLTLTASRAFDATSPAGRWTLYPTYQYGDGTWQDGPETGLDVGVGNGGVTGGLSTRGSQIIDPNGQTVRLAGVGWNEIGAGPTQGFDQNVQLMKAAGFNCVRVSWVNATRDADVARIDQVVAAAAKVGLGVILDNHTNEPGHGPQDNWGAQQKNGLWYDLGGGTDGTDGGGNAGTVTSDEFTADWVKVAQHFANNGAVLGYDLRNEPLAYGGMCTWGDGDLDHDLRAMYERVGNGVLGVDATKLIIAEGPQNYSGDFAGTGAAPWGDLSRAGDTPVRLSVPNRLVYSIHDYPLEIAGFSPDNGADKIRLMTSAWGYLVKNGTAPVWIGEMGSSMHDGTDAAWAQTLTDYANGKLGAQGGPTFGADEKGIGTDWWAWGYLPGQLPEGTQNADGSLRAEQRAVYSQLQ